MVITDKKILRHGFAVLMLGLLSGCAAIGGQKATSDTYELAVAEIANAQSVRRGAQILIAEPTALKALDSENIVVEASALTIEYLAGAQWSDRLPRVVQQKLAASFGSSNKFGGVGLPGQGLAIDYQVITEIRDFGIVVSSRSAKVTIAVKLLNDRTGNVIASEIFTSTVPTGSTAPDAYVRAINAAFTDVSEKMVVWVTAKI